jgi:rhodanese-related sulfurtransferase
VQKTLVFLCLVLSTPALATGGAPQRPTPEQVADFFAYMKIAADAEAFHPNPAAFAATAQAAKAWFAQTPFAPTVFAEDLHLALQRCEPILVVDTRDAASYAAGHVPGAVNIPLATLFEPENLALLPTDGTKIVTMCVTGHTGSMAAAVLGTLGYPAATARFGWLGWAGGKTKFYSNTAEQPQTIVGGVGALALPAATGAEPGGYACP